MNEFVKTASGGSIRGTGMIFSAYAQNLRTMWGKTMRLEQTRCFTNTAKGVGLLSVKTSDVSILRRNNRVEAGSEYSGTVRGERVRFWVSAPDKKLHNVSLPIESELIKVRVWETKA